MTSAHTRHKKSTTVRFFRRAAVGGLRVTFGTLERLAPDAGARLALRLWCTPPRRRAALPQLPAGPGGASTFTGPYDGAAFTVDVDGRTVTGRAWGSGPFVYLAHGWGGSATQLHGFVPPLVAAGYRVVVWDALSHGRSGPGALGPHRSTLGEFVDTLAAVVRAHGPAHAVIAHSLGATATGLAVLDGLPVRRLVLVAPMADPLPYIRTFCRQLGIGPVVGDRLVAALESVVGRPIIEYDLGSRARDAAGLPPLLVVQDRLDREVAPADGVTVAAAWPGRLHRTTGLGHGRILADPEVVLRAVDFVRATDPDAEPRRDHTRPAPAPARNGAPDPSQNGPADAGSAAGRAAIGPGVDLPVPAVPLAPAPHEVA